MLNVTLFKLADIFIQMNIVGQGKIKFYYIDLKRINSNSSGHEVGIEKTPSKEAFKLSGPEEGS